MTKRRKRASSRPPVAIPSFVKAEWKRLQDIHKTNETAFEAGIRKLLKERKSQQQELHRHRDALLQRAIEAKPSLGKVFREDPNFTYPIGDVYVFDDAYVRFATGPAPALDRPPLTTDPTEHHPTLQPDITQLDVERRHLWVFEYQIADCRALFTLRCPNKECDSPSFSTNPLGNERGMEHLKQCGVHFRDERDMVRQYARLVVAGARSKKPSREWAKSHNQSLLAQEELYLLEDTA